MIHLKQKQTTTIKVQQQGHLSWFDLTGALILLLILRVHGDLLSPKCREIDLKSNGQNKRNLTVNGENVVLGWSDITATVDPCMKDVHFTEVESTVRQNLCKVN